MPGKKRPLHKNVLKSSIDRKLLATTLVLVVLGLVAVADASAPQAIATFSDKWYFFKQQFVWATLGVVTLFVVSKINYNTFEKYASLLFLFNIILLIAVLIPAIGTSSLGARRWIILGPVSIQPSELIKLTAALYFAKLAKNNKRISAFLVPVACVALLIMLQPDLGTTLSFLFIAFIQIYATGVETLKLIGASLISVMLGVVLVLTSSYRRDRLMTFLGSLTDPLGKSYHIRQILLALGSGGLFGVGLGQSRQKFLFLPESATDSIFAVLAEELGFIGSSMIIALFAYYVFLGLRIALRAPDVFSKILALGIVSWVGGQAMLNMSAVVALVPLTGIPLPFFSYGGSALVSVLTGTGILLNISSHAQAVQKPQRRR